MKKRKEMTKTIKENRTLSKSTSSYFSLLSPPSFSCPLDLTLEILSKLSAKSVMKFRYVSKQWSSLTTEPYFNNLFVTHSLTRPRLLVTFTGGDKFFIFSISQQNQNRNEPDGYSYNSQPIDSYHMKHDYYIPYKTTESIHGLICFQEFGEPIVWNPTMRKFFPLPKPGMGWKYITVFLGYDPLEGKHKVMCMPCEKNCAECRVLTLGSDQKSWRTVQTKYYHWPLTDNNSGAYGRCINGVLYYHARFGNDRVIMSFDVRSEEFSMISLPWRKSWQMMMISYDGKLACVGYSKSRESVSMWVLVDASKHEWSNRLFSPLSHYGLLQDRFELIGVSDNGELIYVGVTADEYLDIVYLDLKRKMFKRVKYRGIVDDEFRQRNGLGKEPLLGFQYFPNHGETLMSL